MSKKHRNKIRKLKRKHRDRRGINRHHIINKCNNGSGAIQNLLKIYIYKHQIWHDLFHHMTLLEASEFLKRVDRAKRNQGGNYENLEKGLY